MGLIRSNQPCPCGKSSDALAIYDDHEFCFSCSKYFGSKEDMSDTDFTYEYLPWRGVTAQTFETYKTATKVAPDGEPLAIAFPFDNGGFIIRSRQEDVSKRDRYRFLNMSEAGLGGNVFAPGSAKAVTITEGGMDALSAYQMLGSKYPVRFVRSSSTARRDCIADRDFLNSFDHIYLCFDNDDPGQRALEEVAPLFDFNKVFHVKLDPGKDVNEYLKKGEEELFRKLWWNAKRFVPEGVTSSFNEFDELLKTSSTKKGDELPFPTLNKMLKGLHTGHIVLVTAQEGVGKTEFMNALEHHILKTTDYNLGIIHVEQPKHEVLQKLVNYEIQLPVHTEDTVISHEEQTDILRRIIRRDNRVHLYNHFDSDDVNTLLETIRFLVTVCECKYIFFDHISDVVAEKQSDDERRLLDFLCKKFSRMVGDLNFGLIMVSHVNDHDQTRGSRYIQKVANQWVHLSRDTKSEDPFERLFTKASVWKNRYAQKTGPAGILKFNEDTFTLSELTQEEALPV